MTTVDIVLPKSNAKKNVTNNWHVNDAQRIHKNDNTRDNILSQNIINKKKQ